MFLETILTIAKIFEPESGFLFIVVRTEYIGAVLNGSNFSREWFWQPANDAVVLLKQYCDALKHSHLFRRKHEVFLA